MIQTRKIFNNAGAAPYIVKVTPLVVNLNESKTITIVGLNFNTNTEVIIDGWQGTIDVIRRINPEKLEVDLTAGDVQGIYSIVLRNYNKYSNQWPNDLGGNSIVVQNLPNGEELPIRVLDANGDKYIGTAFSKSEDKVSKSAEKAFDGNRGTIHYSEKNLTADHYLGIIMSKPTLLTKIGYNGEFGSSPFRLEGSNNTTNGSDGTWVDLGDYVLSVDTINIESLGLTYNAFRAVWSNADSVKWANSRELILFGKQ